MIHANVRVADTSALTMRIVCKRPALSAAFAARPWVRVAWLVGSYATGEADHLSDVDFLVLADEGEPAREDRRRAWEERHRLREDLAAILDAPLDAISVWTDNAPSARLVPSLITGRVVFDRAGEAEAFAAACFAALGGRPGPEEARLLALHLRAERIIDCAIHRPAFGFLVPACFGLGRAVLRLMGVGPLRSRFDVPRLALERTLVPPRTALTVWRAGVLYYSEAWLRDRRAEAESLEIVFGAAWRFADWAWLMRAAALRATSSNAAVSAKITRRVEHSPQP